MFTVQCLQGPWRKPGNQPNDSLAYATGSVNVGSVNVGSVRLFLRILLELTVGEGSSRRDVACIRHAGLHHIPVGIRLEILDDDIQFLNRLIN